MSKKRTSKTAGKFNPAVFKRIIRKKQNRKDGRLLYYYWNATDTKRSNKLEWQKNQDIKLKLKQVYSKGWKDKFKENITEIKKIEKQQFKHDKKTEREEIELYLLKHEFPKKFSGFVNGSMFFYFSQQILDEKPVLIEFETKLYLITSRYILDFKMFTDEVLDFYFDEVRTLYNKKKLSGASPFLIWSWYKYSGVKLPSIEGTNLNDLSANKTFTIGHGKTEKEKNSPIEKFIKRKFRDYFGNLKPINLITLILKLKK